MTYDFVDYLGSRFDVRVTSVLVHISVRSIGIYPLILTVTDSGKIYYLTRGKLFTVTGQYSI